MDFPPFCALCWLVPGMWLFGWLLTKKQTQGVRWVFGLGLALMVALSGFVGFATYQMAYDDMLLQAVSEDNVEGVEEALKHGAEPMYRYEGQAALEVAREKGNPEILRRLERAAKERR